MFTKRYSVVVAGLGTSHYNSDEEQEARWDYETLNHAMPGKVQFIDRAQLMTPIKLPKRQLQQAA